MKRAAPIFFIMFAMVIFYSSTTLACPAGQSCPAGKDCVSDPTQCVADSTSTSGSSSEPTTTKDQAGLVFEPLGDNFTRAFSFDANTKTWTFYDPRPDFKSINTLKEMKEGQTYWIRVQKATVIQKDASAAPIPLLEGWNTITW